MKKPRQLTIMGTVWDFWPILHLFDTNFESRFMSFYDPWLKGRLDKKKIVQLNERYNSPLLWPYKLARRLYTINKIVKAFKPDLVISHHDDANFILATYAALTSRRKKPRIVLWVRNNPEKTYAKELWSKVVLFGYKHIYKYADVIVAQTKANAAIVKKNFPVLKDKIVVFPNAYDMKDLRKQAAKPLPKNHQAVFKKKVFLNIGRLTDQKGQWQLIRAFKGIAARHSEARLFIIGDGGYKEPLKKLARDCGIADKVMFTGFKKNPYMYMKASFAFVFPSLWEGMPNTVIENLALNKPVIAADCKTGPREILAPKLAPQARITYPYDGEYGVLIETTKEEACFETPNTKPLTAPEKQLAKQMERLLTSRLRDKYRNCSRRVKELDYRAMKKYLLALEK